MSEELVAHADDHGAPDSEHAVLNVWEIFGYLCALTAASSATLILHGLEAWGPITNLLFVMTVSTFKAALVVAFFMHLKFEKAWKYALTIPPCILMVVIVWANLPDIAYSAYTRINWMY